jgi:hypothetical protein
VKGFANRRASKRKKVLLLVLGGFSSWHQYLRRDNLAFFPAFLAQRPRISSFSRKPQASVLALRSPAACG